MDGILKNIDDSDPTLLQCVRDSFEMWDLYKVSKCSILNGHETLLFCTTAFFKAIGLSVKEAAQKAEQMGMLPLIPLTSVKTQDVNMINEKYLDNRHLDIDTAFLEEPHINACHWNWSFNEIENRGWDVAQLAKALS